MYKMTADFRPAAAVPTARARAGVRDGDDGSGLAWARAHGPRGGGSWADPAIA